MIKFIKLENKNAKTVKVGPKSQLEHWHLESRKISDKEAVKS